MNRRLTASALLTLLVLLAVPGPLAAQPGPVAGALAEAAAGRQETPYRQALALYREGRSSRAIEILQQALTAGTLGAERASGWLLLAACQLGVDAPEAALSALDGLDREYPEIPYTTERVWLRGRAHARAGRGYEAAREYVRAWELDRAGRVGAAARDALAELVATGLDDPQRQRLGTELTGSDLKVLLTLPAVEELTDRGDLVRARRLLERIVDEAPVDDYGNEARTWLRRLQDRLERAGPAGFVLGVLAPLTGPDAAAGSSISDAVRLAVGQETSEIRLVFRDTRGTLEGTVTGTLQLIREEGAHLIVGPWVDELALVAAGLAEGLGVPIILPHTQGAAPVPIGENVFQLQATPRLQALWLADVAVDSLGMQTFAVLSPVTAAGTDFAEAFITRVEDKGASVVARQQYYPGATDFTPQLEAIRRQGLALSLADTSAVAVTDETAITAANRDTLEQLVPVGSIDGLVVPAIGVEDAVAIAIQTDFYYLVTTILGGSSWNSYAIVQSGREYVERVVFTDAWSMGRIAMPQIAFANAFYETYGRQPDRAASFAYDAARLGLSAWQLAREGDDRRRFLRIWLTGVEAWEGATGPVNLVRHGRVNDNVYLLGIRQGNIGPLIGR